MDEAPAIRESDGGYTLCCLSQHRPISHLCNQNTHYIDKPKWGLISDPTNTRFVGLEVGNCFWNLAEGWKAERAALTHDRKHQTFQ